MTNKKPHVGIDIDGVLADFVPDFVAYHNYKHGTKYQPADVFHYDFRKVFGWTDEEYQQHVVDFFGSEEVHRIKPVVGAVDGIEKLAQLADLTVITARSDTFTPITEKWLGEHFPEMFSDIVVIGNLETFGRPGLSKADHCRRLGIDVMIEDSLNNAAECASAETAVLLLDATWNQGELPENVHRVKTWQQVVDFVSAII